jgi:hypothetical protein
MRLGLLALAAVAVVVLLRRRRTEPASVVVGWPDGEEVAPAVGTPEHGRIVEAAERALA